MDTHLHITAMDSGREKDIATPRLPTTHYLIGLCRLMPQRRPRISLLYLHILRHRSRSKRPTRYRKTVDHLLVLPHLRVEDHLPITHRLGPCIPF